MPLEEFRRDLRASLRDHELQRFCQQNILHGTPFVFNGREAEYFQFKERICNHLNVVHTEIYIVGSAKLGFSPLKGTSFTLDSDIDIAIVSPNYFENALSRLRSLEYLIRSQTVLLRQSQWQSYHKHLRYLMIGWMRPDLLPSVGQIEEVKHDWFDFFNSISFGRSEVGDYQVTAGVFRTYQHLEQYTVDSLEKISRSLDMEIAA